MFIPPRYAVKDLIGQGWYQQKNNGVNDFILMQGEGFLRLPANATGVSLLCSSRNGEKKISVYDLERGLLGDYDLGLSAQSIDILPPSRDVKIVISRPQNGNKNPIALHDIIPLEIYRERSFIWPSFFSIETTLSCNMNPPCVMCDGKFMRSAPNASDINDSILDKIKPFLKFAGAVSLHGTGEPLLSGKIFDILDCVDPERTYTTFTSNGLLLTEEKIRRLMDKGLKEINLSIDAATAETYGKIRSKGNFLKLKNNIKRLVRIRKEKTSLCPRIMVNMTLMKENVDELLDFVILAHEMGVDVIYLGLLKPVRENFTVKKGSFYFDYKSQVLDVNSSGFKDGILSAKKKAMDLGIALISEEHAMQRFLGSEPAKCMDKRSESEPICKKPWKEVLIGINGDVNICCHMNLNNETRSLGNLNNQDFYEIWNNSLMKRLRRQFMNDVFPSECWACPYRKAD